ncbi:ABC transporter permease [Lysobacter enzymogenes]|uniref:ABC transporter permease n=1 Tax=Lysobacter enzymogenes TaxID=69 RepID=UPI00099BFC74|nr:ABC transporter permease [Lysobacter enzymogenes]UZW61450.1 ABC transporter permease [Lysobacter enzymogenes]
MSVGSELIALHCIVRREVVRILRLWLQTLVPPAVSTALYFAIFGKLIGDRIGSVEGGASYLHFITPGLVMMCVITSSYGTASSSFFFVRFNRAVEEMLASPMRNRTILLGYVVGALVRSLLVGAIVVAIALALAPSLPLAHPWIAGLSVLLAATIFSLLGFINALYAKTLDDIGHVTHFVLTPLAYLGGVFYPISLLKTPWQEIAQVNPLAHMIGAFRYGVLGTGAPGVGVSIAVMLVLTLGLSALALFLLGRGVGTRT